MLFCMDAKDFDWTLVRSFLAVLDAGSLMGAARRLGAQQPTLGRHVAQLEAQLGGALFERTGRGVTPTALALGIVPAARRMAEAAEGIGLSLAQRSALRQGTVRLAASQVAAAYLLPPVLAALQRDEPGLQVELVVSNSVANLLRREADVAVRMLRPQQASLVARKLGEVPVVAAAHRSLLQREGTPRRMEDLLRHRLIGYETDDTLLRGFAAAGFPVARERFALRTDDHIAYGRLVAEGAGIGFVARYNLAHWPDVVPVLPMLKIPPLPCWLVVHREVRGNPLVRRLFDALATALPPRLAG